MVTITATYSPEDNKIRLYASSRLDAETYAKVKAAGFKWAPRQELFVAPSWTPAREDLAIELAGEIEPEEMTLVERAAMKAERLDALAAKRYAQANAFSRRADELSQAFYMGQPILVGHHSERKARKTQGRMHSAQSQAVKAEKSANYWLYRAEGVEHFANMKNCTRTRQNRIKTLLAELRDLQRGINEAHKALTIWEKITSDDDIVHALGWTDSRALMAGFDIYRQVEKGEITPQAAREKCMANANLRINGPNRRRCIEHTLNRLAFERSMLGNVARYEGELTPVILQAFAREHGAEKPKCIATDPGFYQLESDVPLPLHIADKKWLELSESDWRDLMQSTGYIVPEKKGRRASSKPAPSALINPTAEEAEKLQNIWNIRIAVACLKRGIAAKANDFTAIDQARYSANSGGAYSPFKTIEIDAEGREVRTSWERMQPVQSAPPVARIRIYTGRSEFYMPNSIVHISDKAAKSLPIDLDAIEAALLAEAASLEREAA